MTMGGAGNGVPGTNTVVLNSGITGVNQQSDMCENPQDFSPVRVAAAPNGLLIEPGSYRPEGTSGSCRDMNSLSVCVVTSDPYGELTLSVEVPGHVYPVVVEMGLAGTGIVARTVLYSMRPG
jgi:hypothetical protein